MEDYEELIKEYKTSQDKTEYDLAVLERRIWNTALPIISRSPGTVLNKRQWLSEKLGIIPSLVESRSTLLGYGESADIVWKRVQEDGMPLRTATKLMRDARMRSNISGIEISEAVKQVLDEYDNLPIARLPGGGTIHKKTPSMLPRTPPPTVKNDSDGEGNPKVFWAELRGMISGYFHTRLEGMDQAVIDQTWRQLEVDIKVILEMYQHKLDRMKRDHDRRDQGISRSKIIQACHVLNIDPPRPGKDLDDAFRKKAKAHFKKLASQYHPDKSGSEDTRQLYENVVEAYRILEEAK